MRPRASVKAIIDPDGAVLMDLRQGKNYALNDMAVEIWNHIEAGRPPAEIEARLCEIYDVPPETVRQHLDDFLEMLAENGLVESDM
jgi:PqqD family protein of HPr-rel-A system